MPRFVLLEHDHPHLHWDLMLESGPVLLTWRLPSPPRSGERLMADRVFDHRSQYLDYEGPISGGRGHVVRWTSGTFDWQERADDCFVVYLQSDRLRGELRLEKEMDDRWNVEFLGGTVEQ